MLYMNVSKRKCIICVIACRWVNVFMCYLVHLAILLWDYYAVYSFEE